MFITNLVHCHYILNYTTEPNKPSKIQIQATVHDRREKFHWNL